MIGSDLKYNQGFSRMERLYIRVFGAPISGLRIRCRRILPKIDRPYKKILDVGSGTGVFTAEIALSLPESSVLGIDNMRNLVDKANRMVKNAGIQNCHFLHADALHLHFREEFDLVLCIDNLEHIEEDEKVLKNINLALKKEGRAIIHVPNYFRRWFLFKWHVNFDVPGHVRPGYRWSDLMKKIERAGFCIEESFYTYGFLETLTNNISHIVTKAEMKNKYIYSLLFPLLNTVAYFGRHSKPKMGAGILALVKKNEYINRHSPSGARSFL